MGKASDQSQTMCVQLTQSLPQIVLPYHPNQDGLTPAKLAGVIAVRSTRKRSVLSGTMEAAVSAYHAEAVGRSPLSSPVRRLRAAGGRPLQGVCGRLLLRR